jgi:hypothetical protein
VTETGTAGTGTFCLGGTGMHSGSGSGFESGFRRAKMTHKNEKSKESSCFELLDVLF